MHCEDEPSHLTPEEEARIARQALLDGDHRHAVFHLAGALAADPLRREWLVLLDQLAADVDEPLALVPEEPKWWFGAAAVRARLLAGAGRWGEAVTLLFDVAAARPEVPYLAWAEGWLDIPQALDSVQADQLEKLAAGVGRLLRPFMGGPSPVPEKDPRRDALERGAVVVAKLRAARPESATLAGVESQLLRRLGRTQEAIESARQAELLAPSSWTAALVGFALGEAGDVDGACAAYERSLERDPSQIGVRLDLADLLLQAQRYEQAARHYGEVLSREPSHNWAEPSFLFAQVRRAALEGDASAHEGSAEGDASPPAVPDARARLERLASTSERARALCNRLMPVDAWVASLPAPTDATANLLCSLVSAAEQGTFSPIVSVGVSHLEAPSVYLALRLQLRALGRDASFSVSPSCVPSPDPRLPRREVRCLLWRYEGTDPVPVPEPPDAETARGLAALASEPHELERWYEEARDLASSLGPARLPSLLGAMVHPPEPPLRALAHTWVQAVQHAAALTIAALPGKWSGSPRRQALLDLLDGPMDWTIGAAAVALSEVAVREPEAREEVLAAMWARLASVPDAGYVSWLHPVVCACLRCPGLTAAQARSLQKLRAQLEE